MKIIDTELKKGKNVNHNKCRAKTNLDTIQLILHFINFIIKTSISIFLAFPKLESLLKIVFELIQKIPFSIPLQSFVEFDSIELGIS